MFTIPTESYSFILAVLTAVASGVVGSFALMRRMTLAGDAFSHVALPGIGVALLYSVDPIIGGAVALLLGVFVLWNAERFSRLNTEALIGVLFSVSLALGAITIKTDHELVEALFGGITAVTPREFIFGVVAAFFIIGFIVWNRRALVLMLVSKELAKTAGVATDRLQLWFLALFALTVLLGMKFLGVLLMGSLIIIPAAAARNVARDLNSMLLVASGVALVSVLSGLLISRWYMFPLGPAIILIAGGIFAATFVWGLISRA